MRLALAACSLGSDIWTEAAAEYDEDDIVQSNHDKQNSL